MCGFLLPAFSFFFFLPLLLLFICAGCLLYSGAQHKLRSPRIYNLHSECAGRLIRRGMTRCPRGQWWQGLAPCVCPGVGFSCHKLCGALDRRQIVCRRHLGNLGLPVVWNVWGASVFGMVWWAGGLSRKIMNVWGGSLRRPFVTGMGVGSGAIASRL